MELQLPHHSLKPCLHPAKSRRTCLPYEIEPILHKSQHEDFRLRTEWYVVLSHIHAQDDPLNPGQESLPSGVYIVLRRIFNVYMLPTRLWKCVGGRTATELVLDRTAGLELRIVAVAPCRIAEYFLSPTVD